jgi:hypothetical protein
MNDGPTHLLGSAPGAACIRRISRPHHNDAGCMPTTAGHADVACGELVPSSNILGIVQRASPTSRKAAALGALCSVLLLSV